MWPNLNCINEYKNAVQNELAAAFSDRWTVGIVAHMFGILFGKILSVAATHHGF